MSELVRDFLAPADFHRALVDVGIDFFCGVPDSLLKDFCAYITASVAESHHVIAANEGSAVALAAGYHLATGRTPLVYLQNSGLGNAANPLLSLASPDVYSFPMLLLIGWRGEPGKRDEPQHMVQGQVTPRLLDAMGIPSEPLPDYIAGAERALHAALRHMRTVQGPYALLVKRQAFSPHALELEPAFDSPLSREAALQLLADGLHDRDVLVSTTGMASRELFEYRVAREQGHERDFLTVGSMGHASSIALGIALQKPARQVVCLDGDGALLMHMGSLAIVGQRQPRNFKHVVLNNGAHDSVGGQPTAAADPASLDIAQVALACGYRQTMRAETGPELAAAVCQLRAADGPVLLEVRVAAGARDNLGRPSRSPVQNKADLMQFLATD
ncbi:phosphonopyruvate decarboxylase-like [Pollicipes pollicipes]|uniref:phosphonopyruvate decarboxylase-like n=1 Tax=Pollicipes pollicipes TaxID=41117 RepID=UPI0018854642|nr:phosphonopyruvate decarboxylase-like [Pollicipes pollicipes]